MLEIAELSNPVKTSWESSGAFGVGSTIIDYRSSEKALHGVYQGYSSDTLRSCCFPQQLLADKLLSCLSLQACQGYHKFRWENSPFQARRLACRYPHPGAGGVVHWPS